MYFFKYHINVNAGGLKHEALKPAFSPYITNENITQMIGKRLMTRLIALNDFRVTHMKCMS